MSTTNRQFVLKQRPNGRISHANFEYRKAPVAALGGNQILIRTLYISLEPTQRVWMTDMPQDLPPIALGEVMRGGGLGQVLPPTAHNFR